MLRGALALSNSDGSKAKSVRHFSRSRTTGRKVSDTFCCRPSGCLTEQGALRKARGVRGFLLVEATLTIAVSTIGLVLISRGIGASLRTLSYLQQKDRARQIAEALLNGIEVQAQEVGVPGTLTGRIDASPEPFQWVLTTTPADPSLPEDVVDVMRVVTLSVGRENSSASLVRLQTMWPSSWIKE